jgi:hypothetical protein
VEIFFCNGAAAFNFGYVDSVGSGASGHMRTAEYIAPVCLRLNSEIAARRLIFLHPSKPVIGQAVHPATGLLPIAVAAYGTASIPCEALKLRII